MSGFYAFFEQHPLAVPLGLLVGSVVVLLLLVERTIQMRRELASAPSALAGWEPEERALGEPRICSYVRGYLLSLDRVSVDGWSEPRLFCSREAADVIDEYVERRLSTFRFALGSMATGIALFCTFFLIAHVLQTNIPLALQAASKATAGTDQLESAMTLLGEKFMISAVGIGSAVVLGLVTSGARRLALMRAHSVSSECAHLFCTPTSLAASVQRLQLEALGTARVADEERGRLLLAALQSAQAADEERGRQVLTALQAAKAGDEQRERRIHSVLGELSDIRTTLHGTRKDLEQLRSIEVSVKDIGIEVTTQFRKMLKEDLGEQIKEILTTVMVQASEMSERLRSELIDGFQRTIDTEVPKLLESLQGIRQSVEGQASSPVERMLEQLQGVVSGGLRGESAQMSAALKQFAEVVPALAIQLQEVARGMTQDMQKRTTENVKMSESLIGQVAGLLARLESQQSATDKAIVEITRASSAGAEAMMARLEAGSTEVMGGLLKTSRAEMDDLLGRLQEMASKSAQGYGSMEESVGAAAKSILEARDGLASAAQSIRQLSSETRTVVVEARHSSEAAQRAASSFESAAGLLRTGVDGMRLAIETGRSYGDEQNAVIEEHRKVLHELEQLWPKLFSTYLQSFDEKSNVLSRSWSDLFAKLSQITESVGGGLCEATEDLKTSVDRLAAFNKSNGPRA